MFRLKLFSRMFDMNLACQALTPSHCKTTRRLTEQRQRRCATHNSKPYGGYTTIRAMARDGFESPSESRPGK